MSHVCTTCYSAGEPARRKRGYALVSWILFGLFILCAVGQIAMILATPEQVRSEPGWSTGWQEPTFVFFWGWVIHVVFRAMTARSVCPSCNAAGAMVPATSPRGEELLRTRP